MTLGGEVKQIYFKNY